MNPATYLRAIEPGKEEIKVVRVVGIGLNVGLKKKGGLKING